MKRTLSIAILLASLALALPAFADDALGTRNVPVRMTDPQGHLLAKGTLNQERAGDKLNVKIEFHFPDGKVSTESATFTVEPRVVQHSWTFEERTPQKQLRQFYVNFDAGTARGMKLKDDGKVETWTNNFKNDPGQMFSGIGFVYALLPRISEASQKQLDFHAQGFIPRPVGASVSVKSEGQEIMHQGDKAVPTLRFNVHPELNAIARMVAKPKDYRLWFTTGPEPRWVMSEGPVVEPSDPIIRVIVDKP
ncbi:MAG: hypothetical protein JST54_01240 [Deltaproteobacteria bacterium]|nr:hypothetical protein [Deltaproteobacteria bacterium]